MRQPRGPRRGLTLALLLAVALPLILAPLLDSTTPAPAPAPATQAAFARIDALSPGAVVLVAWDFDPATGGEMALVSEALIGHLLNRGVQLVTLSLLPAGPPLAQAQIADLIGRNPSFSGVQPPTIEIGYLPGGDIALRAFSQAPLQSAPDSEPLRQLQRRLEIQSLSAAAPLGELTGFDLLLVLTAEADDGRAWLEQVSSRTGIATIIGASATAGPGLFPYADSGQLAGLLAGYDQSLAYTALRAGIQPGEDICQPGQAQAASCATLRAQFWGQITILAVLALASLIGLFDWLRGNDERI